MTRAHAAVLLALFATGCMGYRTYVPAEAAQYKDACKTPPPGQTAKTVRVTVNVTQTLRGELAESVSQDAPAFETLARRAVEDMQIFDKKNIRAEQEHPDYHFLFDVRVDSSEEPDALSGLMLPFYCARQTVVKLVVLNDRGEVFSSYVASAETREIRHVLLLPLTVFNWPGWADDRARRNIFEALAVHLIKDRKEFL